jgi:hypothetical protein
MEKLEGKGWKKQLRVDSDCHWIANLDNGEGQARDCCFASWCFSNYNYYILRIKIKKGKLLQMCNQRRTTPVWQSCGSTMP